MAPVNRAELALYKVVETKTQRSYIRKMGGSFGFSRGSNGTLGGLNKGVFDGCPILRQIQYCIVFYYMEESVLLGTKPLVDSIHHFIRDPSGVFSVCHLCECRIVQ